MQKPWTYQYTTQKTGRGFIVRRSDAAGNIHYLFRTTARIEWTTDPDRADSMPEKTAWNHVQAIIEGRI